MQFKLVKNIITESDLTQNKSEERIFYDPEQGFFEETENGWELIKGARAVQLKNEYNKQKYYERHSDKSKEDAEKDEAERISRIKSKWTTKNFDNIKDETKEIKAKKQKEAELRAATLEKQQQSSWDTVKVAPSAQSIIDDIKKDLIDNILDNDNTRWDFEATYNSPNPMTIDPSIMLKYDTYEEQPPEDEDKPKPYVYFFFDRSFSFNDRRGEIQKKKTEFGRNIENGLKNAMAAGELLFKTYWFSHEVYDSEEAALARGGNTNGELVRYIAKITEGHPSNVVIVTDSDERTRYSGLNIDGGVWIVFCDSIAESLPKAFNSEYGIVKTYFVEDIWS